MNATELQWIPTLAIEPDPDLTPLQQTHRMAMAEIARTELDLERPPLETLERADRAIRVYHNAASRPRKVACWEFVANELWNARADAIRAGAIIRGSDDYVFISDRYRDAARRAEHGRALEARGHADVRL